MTLTSTEADERTTMASPDPSAHSQVMWMLPSCPVDKQITTSAPTDQVLLFNDLLSHRFLRAEGAPQGKTKTSSAVSSDRQEWTTVRLKLTFWAKSRFFRDFLPISQNTIKDMLLLVAELKYLKNMHKKTVTGDFRRHFAWMSVSYISTYEFTVLTIDRIQKALSCFILTKRTPLTLGLLTFEKHLSFSLGFQFVCLRSGWPQPCCLQSSASPTHVAALCSARLRFVVCAGQGTSEVTASQPGTAVFPAAHPITAFASASCRAAKQQSKVHGNEFCSTTAEGGI